MSSYVLVVGFHHKKGTSVEYVYPELESGLDLPSTWAFIPPTALPDGAHNFDRDSIFFAVPSLEQKPTTLFGVACYRQIDAKEFSSRAPELTRNTVQKSVVFLSPAALFGLISNLLNDITDSFIAAPSTDEGYEILRKGFVQIQLAVDKAVRSSFYGNELLQGLSVVSFVRAYQRDALILLKLLLLERKILFTCETAVHCMSTWLLTLVSLIPGMLHGGLTTCAIVDETWVGERACWPLATLSRSPASSSSTTDRNATTVSQASADTTSLEAEESLATSSDSAQSSTSDDARGGNPSRASVLRMGATNLWSNVTKSASMLSSRVGGTGDGGTEHSTDSTQTQLSSNSSSSTADVYASLPPLTDGSVFDSPLPTDDWGLPLALFSRSYLFLPYVPLHALDMLLEYRHPSEVPVAADPLARAGRRVRGFLCGTTNPLLSQNTRLAEAIVTTLPFPPEIVGKSNSDPQSEGNLEITGDIDSEPNETSARPFLQDSFFGSRSSGVFSRLLNRQAGAIRLCPADTEPSSRLRGLPLALSRAIQLSRLDRIFIDHLVNTAELWYAAKASKDSDSEHVEEMGPREVAEVVVLERFPELIDLEKWIRAQFGVYVKALLLTTEGRGSQLADFNLNYVACFRTTHAFLAWRSQLVVTSVIQQMEEKAEEKEKECQSEILAGTASGQDCAVENNGTHNFSSTSSSKLTYAIASPLVHPGKNFPSSEPTDQLVSNLKQFGNIAADHGRRMMNNWVTGFMKLGTGFPSKSSKMSGPRGSVLAI